MESYRYRGKVDGELYTVYRGEVDRELQIYIDGR